VRRTEGKGDIDVEVLLRGAEKLNEVYEMPGVKAKVEALRTKHSQMQESLRHYEQKVARQTRELDRMNRGEWDEDADEDGDEGFEREELDVEVEVTDEDLRKEEDEIKELERRKKELEERVSGMERDLGGLLR
jgi:predicted  nucleic acid-binding Zn-ribbon protein